MFFIERNSNVMVSAFIRLLFKCGCQNFVSNAGLLICFPVCNIGRRCVKIPGQVFSGRTIGRIDIVVSSAGVSAVGQGGGQL